MSNTHTCPICGMLHVAAPTPTFPVVPVQAPAFEVWKTGPCGLLHPGGRCLPTCLPDSLSLLGRQD